jgi:hypothetical protein
MLRAIVPPVETLSLMALQFVIGGDYGSTVNLVNAAASPATLTLFAFDDRQRTLWQPVQITLRAGEARRASINDLFHVFTIQTFLQPVISGFIRLQVLPPSQPGAVSPPVVGTVEIYTTAEGGKKASMLYAMSDSASNGWIIPYVYTSAPFFTGYTLVSGGAANVMIDTITSDGIQIGATGVISTGPLRFTHLVFSGIRSGYLRFKSDIPIYVLGTVGTTDLDLLDHIPAIRQ